MGKKEKKVEKAPPSDVVSHYTDNYISGNDSQSRTQAIKLGARLVGTKLQVYGHFVLSKACGATQLSNLSRSLGHRITVELCFVALAHSSITVILQHAAMFCGMLILVSSFPLTV